MVSEGVSVKVVAVVVSSSHPRKESINILSSFGFVTRLSRNKKKVFFLEAAAAGHFHIIEPSSCVFADLFFCSKYSGQAKKFFLPKNRKKRLGSLRGGGGEEHKKQYFSQTCKPSKQKI